MSMPINYDFPFYLTMLVILTGLLAAIDKLFFEKKRLLTGRALPWYFDYARSFFPALFFVLIIRSFIIQPYRVPTGSLEPTVMPGDFIVVQQYAYGLRLPVLQKKIYGAGEPKRGDIALFYYPEDTAVRFVKRVVGLPGDHIVYKNKVLTINGKEMSQVAVGPALNEEPGQLPEPVMRKREYLGKVAHDILISKDRGWFQEIDVTVPAKHYFMMGDNRDNSTDSRYWGFVPEEYLIGRAFAVWLSWDTNTSSVRWQRLFTEIH
jgi:signal peptidase I